MHCLVFDIETVPDVEFGRRLYDLHDLPDAAVADAMFARRRAATGSDFLPLHQHRVVAISVALRSKDDFKVWSLGSVDDDEAAIVARFFDGLDRFTPDLVSWNGSGFDLPVLHYRALRHGIEAPRYWETGDEVQAFRWNNYLSRFHWRHIDLMDVLAGFQMRAAAKLDEVAVLLGFPGKLGMSGARVWDTVQAGDLEAVRNYCESDVINTFLVYLRFERMRGRLDAQGYESEIARVRAALEADGRPHMQEFLAAWEASG